MPSEAYRAQVDHLVREDLSVSLSSSSMSDGTGQPVGDRPGQPGEHESSEAQIRTLLDEQKQKVLAECLARISQHEFQAAQAEESPIEAWLGENSKLGMSLCTSEKRNMWMI